MAMWLEHFKNLPLHEVRPGMRGRFLHTNNMTFAFWEIDEGFDLPEHNHVHEQVTQLIEGAFELKIEAEAHILKPGGVVVIPSNAPHSGKAVTACRIFDIFYPIREDYSF